MSVPITYPTTPTGSNRVEPTPSNIMNRGGGAGRHPPAAPACENAASSMRSFASAASGDLGRVHGREGRVGSVAGAAPPPGALNPRRAARPPQSALSHGEEFPYFDEFCHITLFKQILKPDQR